MWIKTDLPEPIIREFEALVRKAQMSLEKSEEKKPERPIKLGVRKGRVTGSLHRRDMYGDVDDDTASQSPQHG
jgi:hypothetical protein